MGILYLARHGETDFNLEGRLQGHTDRPLNDRGREQAIELAARVQGLGIARAGSSTLHRARETAEICARALGIESKYVDDDLRERAYGVFEGLTRSELLERYGDSYRLWQEDNRFTPEGAESFETLTFRMKRGVARAAFEASCIDGGMLIVSHGGAMRSLIHDSTGKVAPYIKNGEVFRVTVTDGRFVVESV